MIYEPSPNVSLSLQAVTRRKFAPRRSVVHNCSSATPNSIPPLQAPSAPPGVRPWATAAETALNRLSARQKIALQVVEKPAPQRGRSPAAAAALQQSARRRRSSGPSSTAKDSPVRSSNSRSVEALDQPQRIQAELERQVARRHRARFGQTRPAAWRRPGTRPDAARAPCARSRPSATASPCHARPRRCRGNHRIASRRDCGGSAGRPRVGRHFVLLEAGVGQPRLAASLHRPREHPRRAAAVAAASRTACPARA